MSDLHEIYNTRIMELAAEIPRTDRLADPDVTATAHSKLCGSTVVVDLKLEGDCVVDYGQTVKACLLGQSSASVVGREIVGTSRDELVHVADAMRDMLKADGEGPDGRWADLRVLQPVKAYRARHASTLLVFEALARAFAEHDAGSDATATADAEPALVG
ncbi:MAG: iron-sulfur cluster assembly scaffold protein [Pseudomonadota bacterium]